jgi:hypothetical protein
MARLIDLELYALSAVAERVQPAQRARVLYNLLAQSRRGLPPAIIVTLNRVAACLLNVLPPDAVLGVFLALRRGCVNHKHATRAVARYLFDHPRAAALVAARRAAVRDALEHALGRDVLRGCAKRLLAGAGPGDAYVRKHLLCFARDPARAKDIVLALYGRGATFVNSADVDLAPIDDDPVRQRPRTITATSRGDIAATLVHLYRSGGVPSIELSAALSDYVARAALGLPRFEGRVALVLDASASTRGYGEREFAAASQIQALRLVIQACCPGSSVFTAGGDGATALPPFPQGDTDLVTPLLDALETDPDLVAIVSDGYENVALGDLARVVATLPQVGVTTPVVFCHSKFTDQDDLALRRPLVAPAVEELEFWHQDDFADLLWALFSRARGDRGRDVLRTFLRDRLARLEKENPPCVTL